MLKTSVLLGMCAAVAVSLTGCPGVACFGVDTCQLQGTWEKSFVVGETATVTDRIVITGNAFTYETLTGGLEGTYEINPFADPKQIDLMITRSWVGLGALQVVDDSFRTMLGIYTVSKETLVLQVSEDGAAPAAFDGDETITLAHISVN